MEYFVTDTPHQFIIAQIPPSSDESERQLVSPLPVVSVMRSEEVQDVADYLSDSTRDNEAEHFVTTADGAAIRLDRFIGNSHCGLGVAIRAELEPELIEALLRHTPFTEDQLEQSEDPEGYGGYL